MYSPIVLTLYKFIIIIVIIIRKRQIAKQDHDHRAKQLLSLVTGQPVRGKADP